MRRYAFVFLVIAIVTFIFFQRFSIQRAVRTEKLRQEELDNSVRVLGSHELDEYCMDICQELEFVGGGRRALSLENMCQCLESVVYERPSVLDTSGVLTTSVSTTCATFLEE